MYNCSLLPQDSVKNVDGAVGRELEIVIRAIMFSF